MPKRETILAWYLKSALRVHVCIGRIHHFEYYIYIYMLWLGITKSNSICVKSSKGKQQGRCGEGELVVYTKDKVDF
jgi:hypothetical protein